MLLVWLIRESLSCPARVITTEIFEMIRLMVSWRARTLYSFVSFFVASTKRKMANNFNMLLEECLTGKVKNYFYDMDIPLLINRTYAGTAQCVIYPTPLYHKVSAVPWRSPSCPTLTTVVTLVSNVIDLFFDSQ